ncbi:aminomethyl-transferring glycine dehydrogenase subunit GcvPA [bacterium]|nr:aminomethyl-transferring glycine dehydrogenase subunit GcvPA [bacterium]
MKYTPHTEKDIERMLSALGFDSIDELVEAAVGKNSLTRHSLSIGKGISEDELVRRLQDIASLNITVEEFTSFLGAGAYDHFIPAAVDAIVSRPEFYTAYTPYQPEVSQGTLTAIFEYQSLISHLVGLDVCNASMYDGASALAEAVHLAVKKTRRRKVILPRSLHPLWDRTVRTYMAHTADFVVADFDPTGRMHNIASLVDDDTACVVVASPNFFGVIENIASLEPHIHSSGALLVSVFNPISLGLLKPPGELGADIAVGEGQPLGIPLGFGGPYLGIFAARKEFIRSMPGRMVAETVDAEGKRGFVMALQTREQHIRRARATSNICTNEGLVALAATVFMTLMGKLGMKRLAELNIQKAHYLVERLTSLNGVSLRFSAPFFNEFAVSLPVSASLVIEKLKEKGFIAGLDLGKFYPGEENSLLVAVTERRTKDEMDDFTESIKEVIP